MRIAVCEDREADREKLKLLLPEAEAELGIRWENDFFSSGEQLLEQIRDGRNYDFLLLDITLEGIDGIRTAKEAGRLLPEVTVAFLTASRDYGPEAFSLNAVHYLLKPVREQELKELLARFLQRVRKQTESLEISSERKCYVFPLNQVVKLQSYNKGVDLYLKGSSSPQHLVISLKDVERQLDPKRFIKISRGLIVSLGFIRQLEGGVCRLQDGTEALLSRKSRKEIRKRYMDYLFQDEE